MEDVFVGGFRPVSRGLCVFPQVGADVFSAHTGAASAGWAFSLFSAIACSNMASA